MAERDGDPAGFAADEAPADEAAADGAPVDEVAVDAGPVDAAAQMLLDGFADLAPQGSLGWNFEDALRRLTEPEVRPSGLEPWTGLPADLWERGRSTKASERVLGDVIKIVAQELTEYTQRAVEATRGAMTADADADRSAAHDALAFLAARVARLEGAVDPLGIRPADLDLPVPDVSPWVAAVAGWIDEASDLPVVVGELGDGGIRRALRAAGRVVTGVDPRGTVVWAAATDTEVAMDAGTGVAMNAGEDGAVDRARSGLVVADVDEYLATVPPEGLAGVVLSGCVDRLSLAGKVELVDLARRALAPGGRLVLLVTDQAAWDASLAPAVRDLLPGRPLHPDAWVALLTHQGVRSVEVQDGPGTVHAVVARKDR